MILLVSDLPSLERHVLKNLRFFGFYLFIYSKKKRSMALLFTVSILDEENDKLCLPDITFDKKF